MLCAFELLVTVSHSPKKKYVSIQSHYVAVRMHLHVYLKFQVRIFDHFVRYTYIVIKKQEKREVTLRYSCYDSLVPLKT